MNSGLVIIESLQDLGDFESGFDADVWAAVEFTFSIVYVAELVVRLSVMSFQEFWADSSNRVRWQHIARHDICKILANSAAPPPNRTRAPTRTRNLVRIESPRASPSEHASPRQFPTLCAIHASPPVRPLCDGDPLHRWRAMGHPRSRRAGRGPPLLLDPSDAPPPPSPLSSRALWLHLHLVSRLIIRYTKKISLKTLIK